MQCMSEALKIPEPIERTRKILAVCHSGRTRSKEIARVLDTMGYNQVLVLGIRDPLSSVAEKQRLIKEAEVIVCASPDQKGDVEKFMALHGITTKPQIMNLGLSESLHIRLSAHLAGSSEKTEIERALKSQGFTSQPLIPAVPMAA